MVRAHASRAEGLRLDNGGEERNRPPCLTCRWLRIGVLSKGRFISRAAAR